MWENCIMKRIFSSGLYVAIALTPALGQTADQKQATVAYLRGLQTASGGFLPAHALDQKLLPSLRATSAAIRALKYFGGKPADAKAAADFVARCFDKANGSFRDNPEVPSSDVGLSVIGVMAVIELKLPLADYRDQVLKLMTERAQKFEEVRMAAAGVEALKQRPAKADDWVEQIRKMRNADGTWGRGDGQARETGSAAAALLRLGDKLETKDKVLEIIRTGQRKDGGFGKADAASSDLESCYRVTRALFMLKEKPADADALRGFIARCRNSDGGYGLTPGQPSGVGSTYFAGIILHWLEQLR